MKKILLFIFLLNLSISVYSQQKKENLKDNFFEQQLVIYFTSNTLSEITQSTSPVNELSKYLKRGIYRTEIVYLILLSIEKKEKLSNLVKEIIKGKSLYEISKEKNYDFLINFKRAKEITQALTSREEDIKRLHDTLINKKLEGDEEN